MKRLTAEEVAYEMRLDAEQFDMPPHDAPSDMAASMLRNCAVRVETNLVPQWQDRPDEDTHARCPWWWCEDCGHEFPPQLLRCYRPLKVTAPGDLTVDMQAPKEWSRWTVSGWAPLVGRVCSIGERPS